MQNLKKYISASTLYKFLTNDFIVLIFLLLIGALLCAYNQYDFFWDIANYHYYNAWAFWEDTSAYKIYGLPGEMNSLLNPLLDVPLYLLIKYFNSNAAFIFAMQGLWFGLLLFLFWKICFLFFDNKKLLDVLCVVLAVLIGATGQATWFQAGSSTNEVQISVFVLTGIYFTLKYIKYRDIQKAYKFFFLGLFLGTALALKPTCFSYIVAGGVSLLFLYKRLNNPIKYIIFYILGGICGYLIFNGYFMYEYFVKYGNPFLPALNSLFSTEWFGTTSLIDHRFIPKGWEFLYYPFILETNAGEIFYYDKRGWIFYSSFVMFFIYIIFHLKKNTFFKNSLNLYTLLYLLIAYILWMIFFGITRYSIVIEMLSALFFVKICSSIKIKKDFVLYVYISLLLIIGYILVSTPVYSIQWPKLKKDDSNVYMEIDPILIPNDSLVIFNNRPTAFLIPLLAKYNNTLSVLSYKHPFEKYSERVPFTKLHTIREDIRKKYGDNIVIIYIKEQNIFFSKEKDFYFASLLEEEFEEIQQKMSCDTIKGNLDVEYYICFPRKSLKNDDLIKPDNNEVFYDFLN